MTQTLQFRRVGSAKIYNVYLTQKNAGVASQKNTDRYGKGLNQGIWSRWTSVKVATRGCFVEVDLRQSGYARVFG